ncbi:MAG: SulP family inorganic anion transporter [Planctomycetota bacterium]|jgi:SulP family sulfate permease
MSEAPALRGWGRSKTEILAGLTVAMALVPEAIAFAFVAGLEPLVGLYSAFIVGLITALFGGRPGMISGATGALAVVIVSLVATHGTEYLFATVVMMGLLQLLAGVFHLGKFIRLVPYPVMLGFVNGLAIVIFLAQFGQFKVADANGVMQWMQGSQLALMLGLSVLTMVVIWGAGKLTKAVPAPLVGILVTTGIVLGFGLDVRNVGDMASIDGGLPSFHFPDVPTSWETLTIVFPYAVILAAIGLIESLLTLNLVAEITETHGGASKECLAQGSANIVTGFFGGMGGCAMIGQSMINVESGGRTRLSGISAALFLLVFILFASSAIEMIPLAALIGVMFMVVIGTFAWSTLRIMRKIPKTDAFVLILVSAVTVFSDLAMAVVVGVIVSALVLAWKSSQTIHTRIKLGEAGEKIYLLDGPLFFASVESFAALFDPKTDPQEVIIDFLGTRVLDHSGLQAIDNLAEKYKRARKSVHLRHLSPDCRALLKKAGDLVEVSIIEDPKYGLAVDYGASFDMESPK